MTPSRTCRLCAGILLLALGIADLAASQTPQPFYWWRSEQFKKDLGLTSDQLARIDAGLVAAEIKVGNLEGVRDYGDVRDVARAYHLLLERGESREAYNVCTGHGHIMRHLLDSLCAVAGFKPTIVQDPVRIRSRDSDFLVGDPGKLQVRTGWSPEIPIERTLEDLFRDARARVRRETGR